MMTASDYDEYEKGRWVEMTSRQKCWWYGKPIECPANFNIDTKECKNCKSKQNQPTEKGCDVE